MNSKQVKHRHGSSSSLVGTNWNQFEQEQIRTTARIEANIRQQENNLLREYRNELALQMRLKTDQKEKHRVKPECNMTPIIERNNSEGTLKLLEKKRLQESMIQAENQRREVHERVLKERSQAQDEIERNMLIQRQQGYLQQQARIQEAQACRSYYEMAMERKREKERVDKTVKLDFFRKEKEMLDKLAKENREAVERIRMTQRRSRNVTNRFIELDCQKKEIQSNVDHYFVEKGRIEKEAQEMVREKSAIEQAKAMKKEMNEVLQAQIDYAKQNRQVHLLEELKKDHEAVVQNVSKIRQEDATKALAKRINETKTSEALAIQVAEKAHRDRSTNCMSTTERIINGVNNNECEPQSSLNLPGFGIPADRQKMIRIFNQDARNTDTLLRSALNHSIDHNVTRRDRSNLIKLALNSFNYPEQRQTGRSASEYELLRRRDWTKEFNIISNQPFTR